MGDISRHRDIFLNTRSAIPPELLARCRFAAGDLTYLELGNYLTDVSQFRDPVFYLFAKQNVWRDNVLPKTDDNWVVGLVKLLAHLAAAASAAALATADDKRRYLAPIPLAVSPLLFALNENVDDLIADVMGADAWIDRMLGTPIEHLDSEGKRRPEDYGYVGRFFQHFIEGITHMIFAADVAHRLPGPWATIDRIPADDLSKVYTRFFTQYFPHEHTDQPPYVWDASKRPGHPDLYGPGPRGLERTAGIMNVVYKHYLGYLTEGLSTLENDWRSIGQDDPRARRLWLVAMGKLLHGIEDWYFHSNIVEMIRFHARKPVRADAAGDEAAVRRFVEEELKSEPQYQGADPEMKAQLERFLYRRLRFPVYGAGTRTSSGGVASTTTSTLDWGHVYPAFPSQQDSAHTLLGALETLEHKLVSGAKGTGLSLSKYPWASCLFQKFRSAGPSWREVVDARAKARGFVLPVGNAPPTVLPHALPNFELLVLDVFRELIPLVPTLLYERERQRLIADVGPMAMPLNGSVPRPAPGATPGDGEIDDQLDRHKKALVPRKDAQGIEENDYARAARYLAECGDLNAAGRDAIVAAFAIDKESEDISPRAPGCGGFLIELAVKLQRAIDKSEARTAALNRTDPFASVATDNGSDNEMIGSHSLMSKDTEESSPFFDDARVLACVASQAVLHLMLDEISAPGDDRLHWPKILRHLIRFPVTAGGWERQAMALFSSSKAVPKAIPRFADLSELAELRKLRLSVAEAEFLWTGKRAADLRQKYVDLERQLSQYRYP